MSSPKAPSDEKLPNGVTLREHVYDGIQEYDQRLPNWWLWTFYLAIIFSVIYWISWYQGTVVVSDETRVDHAIQQIEAARLASVGELNDKTLWKMSLNAKFVNEGKAHYVRNCVACHLENLRGKEQGGIGESLADDRWLYGGSPMDIYRIVMDGSPNKSSGMQAWNSVLGPQNAASVVAYVLSFHQRDAENQAR